MTEFLSATTLAEIRARGGVSVLVGDIAVAIVEADSTLFAIADACLRCAASLARGELEARQVKCAQCGWRYDLATGEVVNLPRLRTDIFATVRVGESVLVSITPIWPSSPDSRNA